MKIRHLLPLVLLASAGAQSAPLPNLVLACPDENAINQVALAACFGYVYQIPTNERIVVSPSLSSAFWRKAADLTASELVLVCTIAVEPGAYSSCRDAAGVRRTAYVPKDSVISGGRNSVTVSKTGGDYTDPVTAANNAFSGDTWCVAPQWPDQPCVMAIGDGIFILRETLNLGVRGPLQTIADGLAVSGSGKGNTMLIADNGVETAVSSIGNVRISDLTVINSQSGLARTTGLFIQDPGRGPVLQLENVAIHVSGVPRNVVAVSRHASVEILDSEITAVGQDATGIFGLGPESYSALVKLERSYVSAERALDDPDNLGRDNIRVVDSRIFGNVVFDEEGHLLEIVGSEVVGNVFATNDGTHVVITDSSIKGRVGVGQQPTNLASNLKMTNTNVEGGVGFSSGPATFDRVRIHGGLAISNAQASVLGSHIVNSTTTTPALLVSAIVQLEQTFVQGAQALAVEANHRLEASSSVLAGPVSGPAGAVLSCTDTYGADYELLSASCQPQVP